MQIRTLGIDLGKTVFHLVGLNAEGEVVMRKKFSRKKLLRFTANLQVALIGMEACPGAHFSGPDLARTGTPSTNDVGAVREAVYKDQQE